MFHAEDLVVVVVVIVVVVVFRVVVYAAALSQGLACHCRPTTGFRGSG